MDVNVEESSISNETPDQNLEEKVNQIYNK